MGKPAQVWIKTKMGAPRTFDQNVPYLKEIANLSSKGYFGKKGSSVRVRRIESEDPVSMFSEFFATATLGAIDSKIGVACEKPKATFCKGETTWQ